jgi:hypothetical protein
MCRSATGSPEHVGCHAWHMVDDARIPPPAWAARHPTLWKRLEYLGLVTDREPWTRRLQRRKQRRDGGVGAVLRRHPPSSEGASVVMDKSLRAVLVVTSM